MLRNEGIRYSETSQVRVATFQYSEKGTESFATHLAAEDFQVGKLREDSRQHRWLDNQFGEER